MTNFSNLIEWAKANGPVRVNVEANSVTFQFQGANGSYDRALRVFDIAVKESHSSVHLKPTAKGTKLEVLA